MSKIRQIIRCHCQGTGVRSTTRSTGVSKNVVKKYISIFKHLSLTLQDLENYTDEELQNLFSPPKDPPVKPDVLRLKTLHERLPEINKALRKKRETIANQWEKYILEHPDGYSKTQFYCHLQDYKRKVNGTMHIEHKAGDKMFIDYCGDKLRIVDLETGEIGKLEVFVAILGCSQLTFIEASRAQTKEDFVESCMRSLLFFGGAPNAIVPDNLKSAVTKSSKYEPIINELFSSFAEHYNTVILPARSYKPKDKALVENAVRLVYQRIYTKLSDPIPFYNIEKLNLELKELIEAHNTAPLKQGESRREIYENEERQYMRPLPSIPFELNKYKICTVMKNGHVSLHEDRHFYSVPYEHIGKKVKLTYNSLRVEIHYKYVLIASHERNYRRNRYTTNEDHLASKHRFMTDWSAEYFVNKASEISEDVVHFIERLLGSKAHPEQGYKACSGVINLAKRVGTHRITMACKRALEYEAINYRMLEDILNRGLDKINPEEEIIENKNMPTHQNLRGKTYYQNPNKK